MTDAPPTKAEEKKKEQPRLREIRRDGKIPDGELQALGYVIGARIKDARGNVYTLVAYDAQLENVTCTLLKRVAADDDDEDDGDAATEPVQINRKELTSDYQLAQDEVEPIMHKSNIDFNGMPLVTDMWKCIVKVQSIEEVKRSSEFDVDVMEKPSVGVVTTRQFKKGAMVLVAYSPNVWITTKGIPSDASNLYLLKSQVSDVDNKAKVVVKKSLDFPKEELVSGANRAGHHASIIAFWAVPEVTNASLANAELEIREVTCKLAKESYTFNLPIIRNTRNLKKGENIVMSKQKCEEFRKALNAEGIDAPEPAPKKQKTKGKGKGR